MHELAEPVTDQEGRDAVVACSCLSRAAVFMRRRSAQDFAVAKQRVKRAFPQPNSPAHTTPRPAKSTAIASVVLDVRRHHILQVANESGGHCPVGLAENSSWRSCATPSCQCQDRSGRLMVFATLGGSAAGRSHRFVPIASFETNLQPDNVAKCEHGSREISQNQQAR